MTANLILLATPDCKSLSPGIAIYSQNVTEEQAAKQTTFSYSVGPGDRISHLTFSMGSVEHSRHKMGYVYLQLANDSFLLRHFLLCSLIIRYCAI